MTREDLFAAIGGASEEDLIRSEEAFFHKRANRRWVKGTALVACLALVVGIATFGRGRMGNSTADSRGLAGEAGDATTFMSYAGPVFPLTTAEGGDGLTAEREISISFDGDGSLAEQTDCYTLTNTTGEEITKTFLYPYVSSLTSWYQQQPTLTVDGTAVETDVLFGGYTGSFGGAEGSTAQETLNLEAISGWEGYQALLSDGSYLSAAWNGEAPDFSAIPVTVYTFSDAHGPEETDEMPNPTISASFSLDYDQTTVLSYGFDGASWDREQQQMTREFSVEQPNEADYGRAHYLIIVGEDLAQLEVNAYPTGGSWDQSEKDRLDAETAGCTVERMETDLDTILRQVVSEKLEWQNEVQFWGEDDSLFQLPFDTYYGLFCNSLAAYGILSDEGMDRYSDGDLERMDVEVMTRICYQQAEVTIPAGGQVTLSYALCKEGSYDYNCATTGNRGQYGYDWVTSLGTNLTFTQQRATLAKAEGVTIRNQNFGFDLENGVTTVVLDPAQEHYYLEVSRAAEDE
jgi:hypothetical protein